MSGGSWNYAYWKVQSLAEELESGEESYSEDEGESPPQHPLRLALSQHMKHLAEVLKAIEWSDSGDTFPDDWIEPTKVYLEQKPIDYQPTDNQR